MAYSKSQAKTLIKSLIDKYNRYKKQGLLKKYNEDNTCKDFILPLFFALGWGIQTSKEVEGQKNVSGGRVDYAFYLDGIPKFFVEAKAIPEDLNDPRYIKQAIDYAYNKGVTWAVLSNFEGIKVFNSEWHTDPLKACVLNLSVDDYLSDFDLLWELSKEGIKKDLLYERARKIGQVAIKERVGERLYSDLTTWRELFFKYITGYHHDLTFIQVDEIIQRILNRFVFIRTCEDRKIEQVYLLSLVREWEANERKYSLEKKIQQLFRNFNEWYDSKLFLKHTCDEIDTEDTPYKEVIEGLYGSKDGIIKYDFNAIGVDVLGRVYEQYLGYVAKMVEPKKRRQLAFEGFEELIKIEKEKRKRKEHGIYYTPKFVVDYIVQNTVGKFLEEKTYNEILNIKILDPACGSGSFLTSAYDLLDKYHAKVAGKETGNLYDRIRILTQNIYGVDLDPQAAEITRLNLLLKTLVKRERLPLLTTNIKEGNSLISGTETELRQYFGEDWEEKRPFNWSEEFPEVFQKGGFDVVIGNPPYINVEKIPGDERRFLMENYKTAIKRFDVYISFIERALMLLNKKGCLSFIIPYPFLYERYAEKLRKFILKGYLIKAIVDLSSLKIFRDALVRNIIIVLEKKPSVTKRMKNKIKIFKPNAVSVSNHFSTIPQAIFNEMPQNMFRIDLTDKVLPLINKIKMQSIKLGDICYVNWGARSGNVKNFVTNKAISDKSKKMVDGRDIGRYYINYKDKYLLYEKEKLYNPMFEELFESPKIIVPDITGDQPIKATYDNERYYAEHTVSLCVPWKFIKNVKRRGLSVSEEQIKISNKYDLRYILGLVNSCLNYFFFKSFLGGGLHVYPDDIKRFPVKKIQFSDPKQLKKYKNFVNLVNRMLNLNKDLQKCAKDSDRYRAIQAEIEKTDKQIDQLVYKLYGLTSGEIEIVEKNSVKINF